LQQRHLFVQHARERRLPIAALCRFFGISRKTGYKWLERANDEGVTGLADRSRRPLGNARAVPQPVVERLVALRREHPTWGARKLVAWLEQREPGWDLPAASTVTEVLKRRDLVRPRRLRQRVPARTKPLEHATAPNVLWCIDFKGHFLVGDGHRCHPFTVTDAHSRALLCCQGFTNTRGAGVKRALERTFRAWGLPRLIRSDNGAPFGGIGTGPLSKLGVWLIKVGVLPEYISPGKPQENGRHERFHLTLKQDTVMPPAASMFAQQRRFDEFRRVYNQERPHEALSMLTPMSIHRPSWREFPSRVVSPEYPGHYEVRRVSAAGRIQWRGTNPYVAHSLAGEPIGLIEREEGFWEIYFGPLCIGRLHDAMPRMLLLGKVVRL
jgi:putative transposase